MPPKFGGAPSCQRCSKAVYMAEQITGPGGFYHKQCLTCKECNRRLDASILAERNSEPYCKNCYNKLFGPKGYGFGSGSGVLSTDSTITDEQRFPAMQPAVLPSATSPPTAPYFPAASRSPALSTASAQETAPALSVGGTPARTTAAAQAALAAAMGGGCPKCGKQVYFAEQVVGPGGKKYHRQCFRCSSCGKGLDSTTLTEKDQEMFCKACYGKKFGPKGYGFGGGAGVLNTEGTN
ncbi:hypothetical protein DFJ73DRAFT_835541 [Zopfochytrium polystomum]|nr:hypothetical protein DFJ73DRAFT_835541 [Zopfochytrium polystomum]